MRLLKKENIKAFLDLLKEKYSLFDVRGDLLSPKRYLYPPVEATFTHNNKTGKSKAAAAPAPFVLFGLSLAELEAITYLDEIMTRPTRDFFYERRRERAVLIGMTDEKFDLPPGGDLILMELNRDLFELFPVTKQGRAMIKLASSLTTQEQAFSPKKRYKRNSPMKDLKKLLLKPELLKDAVKWSWLSYPAIWKRLENECMGCGICTYVCPLCHCFSTEDRLELTGRCATRCRSWSACTLPEFSNVAGGHKFHKGIKERYYNWYFHKFVRGYTEYGKSQCVACGNCKNECPAKIDIEEVLVDIVSKYEARPQ
jgi:sulfhydrogenase subunit beta (sulfur reductase)